MKNFVIRQGFEEGYRAEAAQLEAFLGKTLDATFSLCAALPDQLVGLGGHKTAGAALSKGSHKDIVRQGHLRNAAAGHDREQARVL